MAFFSFFAVLGGAGLRVCFQWSPSTRLNPIFPIAPIGAIAANLRAAISPASPRGS
jgi:hypothetical protein